MIEIFAFGVVLSLLLTVPPWPIFTAHPLPWLRKPVPAADGAAQPSAAAEETPGGKRGGAKGAKR